MADKWLAAGDRLILDDADHAVVEAIVARTDRGGVQALRVRPELGGEERWLLQVEDEGVVAAEPADPQALASLEGFERQSSGDARIERVAPDQRTRFGRGECELRRSEAGEMAVLISERSEATAFVGRPLETGRIDLRFT